MEISRESDILSLEFRQMVIAEIESPCNGARKQESYKRERIYNDHTDDYVLERFRNEMGDEALCAIQNRVSNVSICRKIINKKAVVYKDGVYRETTDAAQMALDCLVDKFNINTLQKNVNKALELHKNCAVYIVPYQDDKGSYYPYLSLLRPYHFDVLVDSVAKEMPRVAIYSCFSNKTYKTNSDYTGTRSGPQYMIGEKEKENKEYVWWSDNYHFTTDEKGEYLLGENYGDGTNPIGRMPFVFYAKRPVEGWWDDSGKDLCDTSIGINVSLTDLYYIAMYQGFGIFYAIGKNLPKRMKIGPRDAIVMDMAEGDPRPEIGFATPNAPIDQHMAMIDQQIKLLLSTNNLAANDVNGSIQDASGISKIIDRAENIEDIEEQRELYRDNEPVMLSIIGKWMSLFKNKMILADDCNEAVYDIESNPLTIKFIKPQPYISEKEKMEILQMKKDLGIFTKRDMIKAENPDMDEEEIGEKLRELEDESSFDIQDDEAEDTKEDVEEEMPMNVENA